MPLFVMLGTDGPEGAARRFADGDPYAREGVFERVEVFETRRVFPTP